MEIRWSLPAAEDLERICERIERDNPEAARRVAPTIYDRCTKLKIKGTYVSMNPTTPFIYVDEQVYRFNHRKETDAERFVGSLSQIAGRRLTWNQLMAALPGGE